MPQTLLSPATGRRLLVALGAFLVLAPAVASAQRANLRDAPPIRQRLEWRDGRHQIEPVFGFSMNDLYTRTLTVGLTYRYYFTNWLGLGFDFSAAYLTLNSSLTEQIESENSAPGKTATPSTSSPGLFGDVGLTFIPLYGKMMWFGKLPVAYDMQIDVGVGFLRTTTTGLLEPEMLFAPMWGLGFRLFFTDWISVDLGFKDYIADMVTVAPAGDKSGTSEWTQNFMFTFGVSFFLAPDLVHGD